MNRNKIQKFILVHDAKFDFPHEDHLWKYVQHVCFDFTTIYAIVNFAKNLLSPNILSH